MMEVAASAVGIVSFGIETCQGLLSYYNDWKGYDSDVNTTYRSIDDLSRTLILLRSTLDSKELDEERSERVKRCLQSCEESLVKLSHKFQKVRSHSQLEGWRQKTWKELQRAKYPFKLKTLTKLKDTVQGIQDRLKLAIQILQLDIAAQVAEHVSVAASRTATIEAQNNRIIAVQQSNQFKKITAWLSPPDPWTNYHAARQRHEPQTGTWLLESIQYQSWKRKASRCLWLYGKAGCGKTILCSTAIDDIKVHCATATNSAYGIFFFSFSDNQKQSYESLLKSLIIQLGWKEPGLSTLSRSYEQFSPRTPGIEELETVLAVCIESFDEVCVLLDALDECPELGDARQNVFHGLERLFQRSRKVSFLIMSRELSDIRELMDTLESSIISTDTHIVNADIQKWVASQLGHDRKLRKLDLATKASVEKTISQKADGMFRWAYCQLEELKKLKSMKPKYVEHALRYLPATLDATYERMLASIDAIYHEEALALLKWLAYAERPLTLSELAEAAVITPEGDGVVDITNRGAVEDTMEILCGLVAIQNEDPDRNVLGIDGNNDAEDVNQVTGNRSNATTPDFEDSEISGQPTRQPRHRFSAGDEVRLAHFSVKEYLESIRVLQTDVRVFCLEPGPGHRFLAQSCLTYLIYYNNSKERTLAQADLTTFPLLKYAAQSWYRHSLLQEPNVVDREVEFLASDSAKFNWLCVYKPDLPSFSSFTEPGDVGSGLYYASFLGLERVTRALLMLGADVNAPNGSYGPPLYAASMQGHLNVARVLLDAGADIDARGSSAVYAASEMGHVDTVQLLLDRGTNIQGLGDSILYMASRGGHFNVMKLLLETAGNIDASRTRAFLVASRAGHLNILQLLLNNGASIDALGSDALSIAINQGHLDIAKVLLENGAYVHTPGCSCGSALYAAVDGGYLNVATLLLRRCANISALAMKERVELLTAAARDGYLDIAKLLLANLLTSDIPSEGDYDIAIYAAAREGNSDMMKLLLESRDRSRPAEDMRTDVAPDQGSKSHTVPEWLAYTPRYILPPTRFTPAMLPYLLDVKTGALTFEGGGGRGRVHEAGTDLTTIVLPVVACIDCPGQHFIVSPWEVSTAREEHMARAHDT